MNSVHKILRKIVIKSSSWKPAENFYKRLYYYYVHFLVYFIFYSREVEEVILRGSVASGDFRPGESDIDLFFIIKELEPRQELRYLKRFWRRFEILYKICPLFWGDHHNQYKGI